VAAIDELVTQFMAALRWSYVDSMQKQMTSSGRHRWPRHDIGQ